MDQVRNNKNFEIKKCFPKVCFQPLMNFFLLATRTACVHIFLTTTGNWAKNLALIIYQPVVPSVLLRIFLDLFRSVQVNEMHAFYDKLHKVFSFLESHQNTHNSVKYEVIWKWHFVMLIHKEKWISLACIVYHWSLMQTWFKYAKKHSTSISLIRTEQGSSKL